MSIGWPSPQRPLSPDRLAKIANALGVPTPTRSTPSRSPPATSSYLVHVVPPLSLPHLNTSLTAPPPPSASGYHTHFRRGTLLPVYATLQLQLAAIAREYALPSTTGLILYLIQDEEPGPRISDDIWKHLWSRVWKAEFAADAPDKLPQLRLNTPLSETLTPPRPSSALDNKDPLKSLIPVVAKVEFDVDARAAIWFNPWMTSRNLNYSKRMESNSTPITLNLPRTPHSAHSSTFGDEEDITLRPTMNRQNIPPRLMLDSMTSAVTSLAYLQQVEESDDETEIDDETAFNNGKRGGGVYDDLGLDLAFQDTEDSHYLLTAKLDQIEKDLAQFSPQVLHMDLAEDQERNIPIRTDLPPPSPMNPTASWPAVPFHSLNSPLPTSTSFPIDGPPSPPRLAVNGITTSAPKSFNPMMSDNPSAESQRRKQLEEEEWGQYPQHTPKLSSEAVIPLSPDPFGRFSSSPVPLQEARGSAYWEDSSATAVDDARTSSSRFSTDSIKGDTTTNNRTTMMSVKSIKRLWRRSSKQSLNLQQQMPPPGRLSPNGEPAHQQHRSSSSTSSARNSLQQQARSATVGSSSGPSSSRPSRPSTRPPSLRNFDIPEVVDSVPANFTAQGGSSIALDGLRFDQDSPYPNPSRRPRPPVSTFPSSSSSSNGRTSPAPPPSDKTSPVPAEPQRNSVRKSILKWKSGGSSGRARSASTLSVNTESRPSTEKMPPSPRIPEQFLQQQAQHKNQSSVAPSIMSRTKSASSTNSRYSEDEGRGPSIDESQFEMVSPKMAPNSLSYPYTTVDRDDERD